MRRPGPWRARMAVGMTGAALAAVLVTSGPARAGSAEESRLLGLSNGLRASVGAPALALDEPLSTVARGWAAKMAAAGTISHNPDLAGEVGSWSKVAENVGMGPDLDTVHRALVASRPHYVNLVDIDMTILGIGVVMSGRTVFVVENFLRRPGPAVPDPQPPPTRPTTTLAPAAAPRAPAPARPAAAPTTTVPATTAVPPSLSPWLALALEMTRGWERATG